ncbi:MAG: hypothetical protein AB7F67_12825, partial [Rhodospirillaceae bacterium]
MRGIPTQLIILALVAVFVVPGILFAGLLLNRYAQSETARYEFEGLSVARAAAAVLDRHLGGLQTTLQALATSDFLENGDLGSFYRQAERLKRFVGADIVLRTLDGQQVMNTRRPWGAELPMTPFPIDAEAIASGRPAVTDVFIGAIANRPLIAVIVAVSIGGQPRYLLHISAETDRIHQALRGVAGPDWLIGIGDRRGTYVTRSEAHERFTGQPGVPTFLARASGREGTFVGESAFGDTVLVGYTRSALSDWLVAASIKEAVLETPLRRALYLLYGFGALVLLAMSGVALWL